MTISERLFKILDERNISMYALSKMTGISRHTIYDWRRLGTNPGADKIMVLCEALDVLPEYLLMGEEHIETEVLDRKILWNMKKLSYQQKSKVLKYIRMLKN